MNTTAVRTRLSLFAIVALGAFSLWTIPLLIVELFFVPQTAFGFDFDDQTLLVAVDDPRSAKAGLHDGDRLDVARMSYDDRAKLFTGDNLRINWPAGTPVTVPVSSRRFGPRSIKLRAVPDNYFDPPQFRFAIWTHATIAFLWVGIGAIVVAMRPNVMTWAFYFSCLAFHPFPKWGLFLGPPWITAILILGFVTIPALGFGGIISFAARFPRGTAEGGWKYFELAALPIFLGLVVLHLYGWLPEVIGTPIPLDVDATNQNILYLVAAAALVALFVKLIRLRGAERIRTAWVLAGFAGCVAAIALFSIHRPFADTSWLSFATAAFNTLGLASFPLCIAYAVVWHRAFALGFVTNRALVYGFFAITFGMVFGVIDWIASSQLTFTGLGIGICVGMALAAGLFMQSQYRRAIRMVDRIFLPRRYAAGVQLEHIRESIRNGARRSGESIAADVADALGLASVAVFRRTSDGGFMREVSSGWSDGAAWHVLPQDDLCRTLTRRPGLVRLSESDLREIHLPAATARPRIAIAVRERGRIERAILIGARESATTLDRDEVRGLEAVFAGTAA